MNPRARRIILRLDVKASEAVAVAPRPSALKDALAFSMEKQDWLKVRLSALTEATPLSPGETVPLRDVPHLLERPDEGRTTRLLPGDPPRIASPGADITFPDRIIRFLKAEARRDLEAAVARHSETLNVTARSIALKDTKTRWGSCSSAGRLNFSWRLILAPPEVLDYVAAHEVSHLLEMNHSDRFWGHVDRCVPHSRASRQWLRTEGRTLQAFGRSGTSGAS